GERDPRRAVALEALGADDQPVERLPLDRRRLDVDRLGTLDVLEPELAERVADHVRDARVLQLAAFRHVGDVEVGLPLFVLVDADDLAVRVRDRDLLNARAGHVQYLLVEPLRRVPREVRVAVDQPALRLAGAAHVALRAAFRVADDHDRRIDAVARELDRDAGSALLVDVLDADPRVELGVRGLALDEPRL